MASSPHSPIRTAASRRGSPGANSQASARRNPARTRRGRPGPASPAGIGPPGAAGEAEDPFRGNAAVPGPPGDVGDGLVDADLGDLAAAVADGLGPGLADGGLAGRGQGGEALEDLDVAAVAGRQVAERDRGLVALAVDGDGLEAGLACLAGVGEQPPPGQRPGLEPGHPADQEQGQEDADIPARPPRRRHRVGRALAHRGGRLHARHATAHEDGSATRRTIRPRTPAATARWASAIRSSGHTPWTRTGRAPVASSRLRAAAAAARSAVAALLIAKPRMRRSWVYSGPTGRVRRCLPPASRTMRPRSASRSTTAGRSRWPEVSAYRSTLPEARARSRPARSGSR